MFYIDQFHNKERARTNWSKLKNSLLKELFLQRFFENLANEKEGDDESGFEEDEVKTLCQDLLIKPQNKKRICYEYFISFIAMSTVVYNTYALFVADVSMLYNYIVIPFY